MEIIINGFKELYNDLKKKKIKKQIPNILTLTRLFSPLVIYFINNKKIVLLMLIFFSLTDFLDGYLARRYQSVSRFGAYLDALVDKVFALTLLIVVLPNNYIIFALEIFIIMINLYAFYKKKFPKTIYIGKIKTVFLFLLIIILNLRRFFTFNSIYIEVLMIVTVILQIITLVCYILKIKNKL